MKLRFVDDHSMTLVNNGEDEHGGMSETSWLVLVLQRVTLLNLEVGSLEAMAIAMAAAADVANMQFSYFMVLSIHAC